MASPPRGKNRFMPPVPVKPWTGIRNALRYGRGCIQPDSDSAHFSYDGHNRPGGEFNFLCHGGEGQLTPGEDCLQLNVWTPGLKDNRKRPVMVFYHGGGFSTGFDNALASYDGESLARHDVVVVTCNHRLNLFGYLNLPEVGGIEIYRQCRLAGPGGGAAMGEGQHRPVRRRSRQCHDFRPVRRRRQSAVPDGDA